MIVNALEFKTWSTLFYLIPFGIALNYQIWLTIIPLGALIIVCLYYHLTDEERLGWMDHLLAWIVIASNILLCYLGEFSQPYFGIALVLAFLSLYLYVKHVKKKYYSRMHGFWHIVSGLITVFSLLTFIAGK